jgi:hypothetical protein
MNCSEAERLFDAYLDGELNGSLRFEFDAHRLHCPMCQRKLAMMEACEHILVGDQRGPALSDDFTERVMSQVSIRGEQMRRSRTIKLFIGAAVTMQAAAAVVFVIVWNFGQDRDVQPPRMDPKIAMVDPALRDKAIDERDEVLLYDLIRSAVVAPTRDVTGLSKYTASFTLPDIAEIFGPSAKDEPEAPPKDPLKL